MVGSHGVTVLLKNNIIFTNLSFFLVNIFCFKSPKIKNDRLGLTIFTGEGYCHIWAIKLCDGYGFQAASSGVGCRHRGVSVQNRVSFFKKLSSWFKTESIRKLSNFNFQWTKPLCQNNLNDIIFFFTFFRGYRCNQLCVITPKKISNNMSNFPK